MKMPLNWTDVVGVSPDSVVSGSPANHAGRVDFVGAIYRLTRTAPTA